MSKRLATAAPTPTHPHRPRAVALATGPEARRADGRPLRILLLEDSPADAELVRDAAPDAEAIEWKVVGAERPFRAALTDFVPDVILADRSLPGFSGVAAVAIAREWDASVPCILISGVFGEELAVEASHAGATDYVLKRHLEVLWPAVRRALDEAAQQRTNARLTAELTASEAAMRGSLDAMVDPFMICSPVRDAEGKIVNFRVVYANRAAAAFIGVAPDALAGAPIPGWLPELRGRPFLDAVRDVIETGVGIAEDGVALAARRSGDGQGPIVLNIQIVAFADGFFAAWRDVTESERLVRERARLAATVEGSADAVVITDRLGLVTDANRAFLVASGRGRDELIGHPAEAVVRDLVGPEAFAGFERAGLADRPWLTQVDRLGPGGAPQHLDVSMAPVRDARDDVTGFVVTVRDVTDLRNARAELDFEGRIRLALAESLQAIPEAASVNEAAQVICDALVRIPLIDLAGIEVFLGADDVLLVGLRAPIGYPIAAGDHLPPSRAAIVRQRAALGPWAVRAEADHRDGGWSSGAVESGLRAYAYGPIAHGETVVGALIIGTFDERFAGTLVDRMPGIASFGTTSSALLARRMHEMRREAELRTQVSGILAELAFHPVFQPIVHLQTGEVVGYEALTRFDSGQRPDLCFADAWTVGLGPEMERTTLEAAVTVARRLPPGKWLNVNISPRLLTDPECLSAVLREADRPLVLEVTEHDVIADYVAVHDAIRSLGLDVRLAVDDAGAGIANFGHIIELRPDFVKLDISVVRLVNLNLGRQALVVGMRHFARTAGCRLIAEGVETVEEARTLTALGVEFGQGYLFGRPEPVETWAGGAAAHSAEGPSKPPGSAGAPSPEGAAGDT